MEPALELMRRLGSKYPVWYALGNHEYRMMKNTECYGTAYQVYEEKLKAMGVTLLHNDQAEFQVRGAVFAFTVWNWRKSIIGNRGQNL